MSTTQQVQILGGLDTIGGLRGHASKGDAAWPKSNICNAVCFARRVQVKYTPEAPRAADRKLKETLGSLK